MHFPADPVFSSAYETFINMYLNTTATAVAVQYNTVACSMWLYTRISYARALARAAVRVFVRRIKMSIPSARGRDVFI